MIGLPSNKTNLFITAFLAAVIISGCGPSIQATLVHKESPVEVYLARSLGKGGTPVDADYQHPLELSPAEVYEILRSLKVRIEHGRIQRFMAKTEDETGPAFSEENGSLLAAGLSKALAAAGPADRVHFQINHPNLFHGGSLSTGVVFVKGERLHIILQGLRYAPGAGDYDKKSRFKAPAKAAYGQKLAVLPGTYQKLFPTDHRKLQSRWVTIDYRGLLSSVSGAGPNKAADEISPDSELEEKLEKLKALRERGLITEEVYRKKQEELLRDF